MEQMEQMEKMETRLNKVTSDFDLYARNAMREWRVPGMAAAVVKGGSLICAKGFGVKKQGGNNPVDVKTVFQAGSLSKGITATLVAMLVDEGRIQWLDRVRKHLPWFKLHDPLATEAYTVQDLITNCSGLPPYSGHLLSHLGFDRAYIIKNLHRIKPSSGFRQKYSYQNNMFLVAAALVEQHTGRSWETNVTERIIRPLGMENTSVELSGYAGSDNVAHGHCYNGSGSGSPIINLPPDWPYHYWVYTLSPAAGLNSNVLDLAKWLELYLEGGNFRGNQIISRQNLDFLHVPRIDANPNNCNEIRQYCAGWIRSRFTPHDLIWHNGGTSGMKSAIAVVPEAGIGIVVLCNLFNSLLPEALIRVFTDLWFGNPQRDWSHEFCRQEADNSEGLQEPPGPRNPPRPLKQYTGTYYNDLYGPVSITTSGGALKVTMGPKKISSKLRSWGGDTFVLYWPGVLTSGAGVQFHSGRSGRINAVAIEGMNDDLTGVFIKGT